MEEIVHAWFSRAGAMPLSLIGWMGPIESKGSGAINAILRRYAPRFSDLHICVTEPGLVSNLLDNMSFPWLQSLNLCNLADGGPGTPSPPPLPISTFRESPRLRHLNLERIPLVSLKGIRWELLESFATHEISPQECLDVLCKSPSLLKFEFYGSKENSYAVDQRVISHSTLATFHLLNNNCEIMRHLTLPALRVLSFHLQELDDDDFLPFLSRSRGELTSFAFYSLRLGPLVLSMLWFQHMTHLTSLSLSELEAQSGTNVLRALNRHHDPGFLPALADLTLVDWKSDQVDAQLVDALDSRCTATEVEDGRMQLKAFDFIWMDAGPYTADLAFLTSLIDDYRVVLEDWKMRGLEVYIGTEEKNYFG
ncbi:hypothetical protein B0H16DRAFT_1491285 [Mycena metata]|uniref:Uncharacterized protein n=1 Tax=Mycena metata TaxID=1033252 RepID=A0AAD7KIU2_9AGAR|nr:hypothetical protein B0H16DRAFT_1491285 [Mycena metata]